MTHPALSVSTATIPSLLFLQHKTKLMANWHRAVSAGQALDQVPVVKLLAGRLNLLLATLDPTDENTAFGLADIPSQKMSSQNHSYPELISIDLSALEEHGFYGIPVYRVPSFSATKSLRDYAETACHYGRIIA